MKIKNANKLSSNPLRRTAMRIMEAGLQAVDTKLAVREGVSIKGKKLKIRNLSVPLDKFRRIFVCGVGKCAVEAAETLEQILGPRLVGGLVIGLQKGSRLRKIKVFNGTHPEPSVANVSATKKLISFLESLGSNDLLLFIVSGGGSTLLCQPRGTSLRKEVLVFRALTNLGVEIKEMNLVRKHLSLARGGFLAKHAYPATTVALIFSDVIGNDLRYVSSAPFLRDSSTAADALKILKKYSITKRTGISAVDLFETPKEAKYFRHVSNILLVSNELALKAMSQAARHLGYHPFIKTSKLRGEARKAAAMIKRDLKRSNKHTALLYGGETTVHVTGSGKGGRNQELALATLAGLRPGQAVVSVNTDGRDNSDHAGAVCDILTMKKSRNLKLKPEEFLKKNDSYNFFKKTGDMILTGPTGSNVADLVVALKE